MRSIAFDPFSGKYVPSEPMTVDSLGFAFAFVSSGDAPVLSAEFHVIRRYGLAVRYGVKVTGMGEVHAFASVSLEEVTDWQTKLFSRMMRRYRSTH